MRKIHFFNDVNHENAANVCLLTNIMFMLIHIFYMAFFIWNKSYILGYYNIFITALYFALIFYIKRGHDLRLFFYLTFTEVVSYIAIAVVLVGWGYGFQYLYVGIIMLVCYGSYMTKKLTSSNSYPVLLGMICLVIFVGLAIYTRFVDPIYKTSKFTFTFSIIHVVTTIVFDLFFGYIFANMVFKLEEKLHSISITDALTNIYNRNGIDNVYKKIVDDALSTYIVAIYDIDDFKKCNDTYGHPFGDMVLTEVASIIKNDLPDSYACRWGGEEFISIIKKTDSDEVMMQKIDEVRKKVESTTFQHKNKKVGVTITIGASFYDGFNNLEEWVASADRKLYKGKTSGKNKLVY